MAWPDRQHPNAFLNWAVVLSYLPALGVASCTYARLRPAHRVPWRRLWRTPSTLPALMLCSIAFRESFLVCMTHCTWWTFVDIVNRISINLSFTIFALVASHWSRIATALSRHRSIEHPRLLLGFIVLVWLVDILALVAMIAADVSWDSEWGKALRNVPLSAFFALFAVLVLVQGLRMHLTFRKHGSLLLEDKATHNSMVLILSKSDILYPWFYYVVPETLQISLVCLTLLPRRHTPPPPSEVELDDAGVLRKAGPDSRSASSIGHAPSSVSPLEDQGGFTWEQPLLEEWAREDELLGSGTMHAVPATTEEE